jgi:hypothetical protein
VSFAYGPLTDVFGRTVTFTSDGNGGYVLSCPKYSTTPLAVSAANLANGQIHELVQRLAQAQDVYANWRNLSVLLGQGDPGESQIGSPE